MIKICWPSPNFSIFKGFFQGMARKAICLRTKYVRRKKKSEKYKARCRRDFQEREAGQSSLYTKLVMSLVWIGNYCRPNGDWLLLYLSFFPLLLLLLVMWASTLPCWPIPLGGVVGVRPAVTGNGHLPCSSSRRRRKQKQKSQSEL